MRKNVTISLWWNHGEPDENAFPDAPDLGKSPHAQKAMEHMGIVYAEAVPQPIADAWTFFDCQNIPPEPHPKWMTVWEGGKTPKEIHNEAMLRVKAEPEPEGQKFPVGSRVMIAEDLGPYRRHFKSGVAATVEHTYAHAFDVSDMTHLYSLNIDGYGSSAWYEEEDLTPIL